ncbi:MAG: SGNH/GDSL hydrolase family protein [Streptosporangiaceae bacterium]
MRLRRILTAAFAAAGLVVAFQTPVSAAPVSYYVALGDSLARGYLPGQGDTDQGYVDRLYTTLKAKNPGLELVKLGCSGETTVTLIDGTRCSYPDGSQLAAATKFLTEHRGQVAYVTLDIGGNDVKGCAAGGSVDFACVAKVVVKVPANLQKIASEVRKAGGAQPAYAGMTYYDPFLASWLTGGESLARQSVLLLNAINGAESLVYAINFFRVVDVSATFATNDFTTKVGDLPLNVSRLCAWTYMCSQGDIHPNVTGYQQIAAAFAKKF